MRHNLLQLIGVHKCYDSLAFYTKKSSHEKKHNQPTSSFADALTEPKEPSAQEVTNQPNIQTNRVKQKDCISFCLPLGSLSNISVDVITLITYLPQSYLYLGRI